MQLEIWIAVAVPVVLLSALLIVKLKEKKKDGKKHH